MTGRNAAPGVPPLPHDLRERRALSQRVQAAIVQVLRCMETLGMVKVEYPRPKPGFTWQSHPTGIQEVYADLPCPSVPPAVPGPTEQPVATQRYEFVSCTPELNDNLRSLARSLMPVQPVLSGLGIGAVVCTERVKGSAGPPSGGHDGGRYEADLLLEDDGHLGLFGGPDADSVLWERNASRVQRLTELLPRLHQALDRVERTVGPGAVLERVWVVKKDRKCFVTLDDRSVEVTEVYEAGTIFNLLRDEDGDFVPGKEIASAVGLRQFKPGEFKKQISGIDRRLGELINSVQSRGTRLVLPLPSV